MTGVDLVRLLQSIIRVEVDLFDEVDACLRRDADMMLIELLPLRVIFLTIDCRIQDYADAVAITVGGASKSIDRLETRGWVRRVPHPIDRRSSILEATESGNAARVRGDHVAEQVMREQLSNLTTADLARLDGMIKLLDPTREDA